MGAIVLCALLFLVHASSASAAPSWLAPVDLSATGQTAQEPQVAVDAGGTAVAVWERSNGANTIIQAATRAPGGTWQAPVDVSAVGQSAAKPQVAVDPGGTAVAVWERYNGTNVIIQAATRAPGGTWQAPVDLSVAGQNAQRPQVAVDAGGDAVAIWSRYDGTNYIVQAAIKAPGGPWQAPVDLSVAGQNAQRPQVAVDPSGDAVAVWERYDGTNYIVQAATRAPGGIWQAPVDLSAPSPEHFEAQVAVDAGGDAVAIWSRYDGTNTIVQAATRVPTGPWQAPVDLSAAGQNAVIPQVAVDPGGNAVAVWERLSGANRTIQAATRAPGGPWQAPVDLSAPGQDAIRPQVAVDPGGDAVAVWYRSNGANLIIQAATRAPGGIWQAPVDLSVAGQNAFAPQVAVDPDGNAVAVWFRSDGIFYIVQAAGYDASGPQLGSLSIPASGTVGQSLSFLVSPLDVWSAAGPVSWSFGDGSSASGAGATHAYSAPGTYTVTVSVGDALANGSSATGTVTITAAPVGPPEPPPPGPVHKKASVARLVDGTVKVKDGKALLRLRCPAGGSCQGVVKLGFVLRPKHGIHGRVGSLGIGKAAFRIAAAEAKTVPVKLSAEGKARVRAAAKTDGLKARLTGTGVEARTVVLKESRRR